MKIQKIDKKFEVSFVAKFTRVLIAVNLVPVTRTNSEQIRFSWFSLRTFLFLIGSYSPLVVILISLNIMQADFTAEYYEKSTKIYLKFVLDNVVISICFLVFPNQIQ